MTHRGVSAALWLLALIAYIRTGRLARRSPFYGGGTVVLSWVGLVFQCIGWIAIVQGWFAVNRWAQELGGPDDVPAGTRRQYVIGSIAYVLLLLAGGIALRK